MNLSDIDTDDTIISFFKNNYIANSVEFSFLVSLVNGLILMTWNDLASE